MSTVHTLFNSEPPGRTDDLPWSQVRFEESLTGEEPVVVADTQDLELPLDTNPEEPQLRDLTWLSDNQIVYVRLVFLDENDDESLPTNFVLDDGETELVVTWAPTMAQVATFLRARTKDSNGNELGIFNANTRPTNTQAIELTSQAINDVVGQLGIAIPTRVQEIATSVATIGAAMLIELSYFPEQVARNNSPYEELNSLYKTRMRAAREAIERAGSSDTEDPGVSDNMGFAVESFGEDGILGQDGNRYGVMVDESTLW